MNCALCLRDAPLCRSHIIPEFLYEPIYDESHRLKILSTLPERPTMFKQKGIWEKLLCERCEQRLSVWEGYASKALFGGEYTSSPRHGRLTKISGLDYKKLKLFQLSTLWRAGVSSHELFSAVKLGPHQELLRAMLFEGEPGPPNRYGCVMFGIEHNGEALKGVLIPPKSTHIQGHKGDVPRSGVRRQPGQVEIHMLSAALPTSESEQYR